jgi:hypothetical protein
MTQTMRDAVPVRPRVSALADYDFIAMTFPTLRLLEVVFG